MTACPYRRPTCTPASPCYACRVAAERPEAERTEARQEREAAPPVKRPPCQICGRVLRLYDRGADETCYVRAFQRLQRLGRAPATVPTEEWWAVGRVSRRAWLVRTRRARAAEVTP